MTAYATQCDEMFQVLRRLVRAASALGATTSKKQGSSADGNEGEEPGDASAAAADDEGADNGMGAGAGAGAGARITDVPKTVRSTSMGTDDLAGMEEEALVLRIASAIVNHASTDATESNIDLVVPGLLRLRAWSIST